MKKGKFKLKKWKLGVEKSWKILKKNNWRQRENVYEEKETNGAKKDKNREKSAKGERTEQTIRFCINKINNHEKSVWKQKKSKENCIRYSNKEHENRKYSHFPVERFDAYPNYTHLASKPTQFRLCIVIKMPIKYENQKNVLAKEKYDEFPVCSLS